MASQDNEQATSSIREICKRAKITAYLEAMKVNILRAGNRQRCLCMLPGHETDKDPSFYITTRPDGSEVFKCFGCNRNGDIITLMEIIEKRQFKEVIRSLSKTTGVELGKFIPKNRPVPMEDVMPYLCAEDKLSSNIANWAMAFLEVTGGTEDAVNRLSKIYEALDQKIELGDLVGIKKAKDQFQNALLEFQNDGNWKNRYKKESES